VGHVGDLSDLVLDRGVTADALDLVIRDVVLVHKLGGVLGLQDFRLVMTFYAFALGDVSISLHNIGMAFLAGHPPGDVLLVVEVPAAHLDVALGLKVAGRAASDGARKTFFFALRTGFVIVANITVDFVNGEVRTLDELGVTGGTTKFHPPP
jgi:hypothetical protein